ncbi:MAG: protein kinase, partial [Myxococcota bacterium]
MDSPFVVPVLDVLEVGGRPALLMPWIRGGSLFDLLAELTLTRDEGRALFADIVAGVAHAHAHGLVHRDLKPANVLLELRWGRVRARVADFGIASAAGDPSAPAGTRGYLAPEVEAGEQTVDPRSDLWSLGALLADLLPDPDDADRTLVDGLQHPDPAARHPATAEALRQALADVSLEALGHDGRLAEAVADRTKRGAPAAAPRKTVVLETHDSAEDPPSSVHHNFRSERNAFVDRPELLARLRDALGSRRVVTLVGPAGSGKSRLALHLGRNEAAGWPGGVWWVDAHALDDGEQLVAAIAQALNVPASRETPWQTVAQALSLRGRALVVVDNVEHLVTPLREGLPLLLDHDPGTTWLFTSRVVLHAKVDELVLDVGSMTPAQSEDLFAQRARTLKPAFEAERETLAALLRRLDHLPLAIELAAARIRLASVDGLLDQMNQRFRLLASPDGTQTLQGALQWSWDLLDEGEQQALAQLSVLEGEFDGAAAEAVWGPNDVWALDRLQSLVDKSLVRVTSDDRFVLLQSIRDFVAGHLTDPAARDRHARFFARYGTVATDAIRAHGSPRAELRQRFEDLSAAARHAITRASTDADWIEDAAGLVRAVGAEGDRRGQDEAMLGLVDDVLALPLPALTRGLLAFEKGMAQYRTWALDEALASFRSSIAVYDDAEDGTPERAVRAARGRGQGWLGCAFVLRRQHDVEGAAEARRHAAHESLGADEELVGLVAMADGNAASDAGRDRDALAHYHDAILHLRAAENHSHALVASANRAMILVRLRDPQIDRLLAEMLDEARARHLPSIEAYCLRLQAGVAQNAGSHSLALELAARSGHRYRQIGQVHDVIAMQAQAGFVLREMHRLDDAASELEQALALARRVGDAWLEAALESGLGAVRRAQGQRPVAYELLTSALPKLRAVGNRTVEVEALG